LTVGDCEHTHTSRQASMHLRRGYRSLMPHCQWLIYRQELHLHTSLEPTYLCLSCPYGCEGGLQALINILTPGVGGPEVRDMWRQQVSIRYAGMTISHKPPAVFALTPHTKGPHSLDILGHSSPVLKGHRGTECMLQCEGSP
jgi:hypothetical protein